MVEFKYMRQGRMLEGVKIDNVEGSEKPSSFNVDF